MHFSLERASVEHAGIPALANISLDLSGSGVVVLSGPTGAGKTTLLRLLYADLAPTTGQVMIDGNDLAGMSIKKRQALRTRMGIIEQNARLVSDYTVFDNVLMPFALRKFKREEAQSRCLELLADLNISYIRHKLPRELSGGERHLVALARALAMSPEVIIADEPAGALDKATATEVASALKRAVHSGVGVIVSTHNEHLSNELPMARHIVMSEGSIVADEHAKAPSNEPVPPSREAEI